MWSSWQYSSKIHRNSNDRKNGSILYQNGNHFFHCMPFHSSGIIYSPGHCRPQGQHWRVPSVSASVNRVVNFTLFCERDGASLLTLHYWWYIFNPDKEWKLMTVSNEKLKRLIFELLNQNHQTNGPNNAILLHGRTIESFKWRSGKGRRFEGQSVIKH